MGLLTEAVVARICYDPTMTLHLAVVTRAEHRECPSKSFVGII